MNAEEWAKRPYLIRDEKLTKEQLEKLRTKRVMIGTPMYDALCCATYHKSMLALVKLFTKLGIEVESNVLFNESLINRARNSVANFFLESDYTHLLFIDADIGFRPIDVLSMLLVERGVVGAAYPKKSLNFEAGLKAATLGLKVENLDHCMGHFVFRAKERTEIRVPDLYESKYLGTGFMLIDKPTFEKIKPLVATYEPNSGKAHEIGKTWHEFFPTGVVGKELLSEDYYFCYLAEKAGEKMWLCPWIYLTHMGKYEFKGCLFCSNGKLIHNLGQPMGRPNPTPPAEAPTNALDLLKKLEGK